MSAKLTLAELGAAGADRLEAVSDSARLESELLLALAVDKTREFLYAWPQTPVSLSAQASFAGLLGRRAAGEPMSYITGWREFWSLDLMVTPDTLIPRAETERLVELALPHIATDEASVVADIGTGSGAIALALAVERPQAHIIATDVESACVELARANAARLDLANVEVRQGDLCDALTSPLGAERVDVLVSNPPYVAELDPHLQRGDARHEPRQALVGGTDGLDIIRRLVAQGREHLHPGGHLLMEHGFDQGAGVRGLLREAGYRNVQTYRDYGGLERVTEAQAPTSELP